ncbi:MAG: hypothetical protein VKL39_19270, partial [Leptolyngbyaceae bacterium]|nr:hypothetical protein [Leptolyngbyaceae bacterium]
PWVNPATRTRLKLMDANTGDACIFAVLKKSIDYKVPYNSLAVTICVKFATKVLVHLLRTLDQCLRWAIDSLYVFEITLA